MVLATIATGIASAPASGVTNSLWGGYNWGRGDIDINVNRYNNINVNRSINNNQTSFAHNSAGRKGMPYRDAKVDQKYGKNVAGKDARNDYRGRDANDAKRDAARETMAQRTNDPKTREKLQQEGASRAGGSAQDRATAAKDRSPGTGDRSSGGGAPDRAAAAKDRAPGAGAGNRSPGGADRGGDRAAAAPRPAPAARDNALKGAGNGNAERANMIGGRPAVRPRPNPLPDRKRPHPARRRRPRGRRPSHRPARHAQGRRCARRRERTLSVARIHPLSQPRSPCHFP